MRLYNYVDVGWLDSCATVLYIDSGLISVCLHQLPRYDSIDDFAYIIDLRSGV